MRAMNANLDLRFCPHIGLVCFIGFISYIGLADSPAGASAEVKASALQKHLDTTSSDPRALFDRAQKERNAYHLEASRKLFEQLAQTGNANYYGEHAQIILKTEFPSAQVSPACEHLFSKAGTAMKASNYHDAITYFTELTRLYPRFELGWAGLCDIYMRMDDVEKAAEAARSILAINENFVQAWYILAHDSMAHQDLKGAIDSANRAHELDPYNATVTGLLEKLKEQAKSEEPD